MDLDSALKSVMEFDLTDHCHVNSNEDGDRFVGIKADSDNAMVYFPIGYQLPESIMWKRIQPIKRQQREIRIGQERCGIKCHLYSRKTE